MSAIPATWATISLYEIAARNIRTLEPKLTPREEFELYSVPAFSTGAPEIRLGSEILSIKQIVQEGDVLLCKIVPHLNRVWKVGAAQGRRQIASGEWIVYRNHHCVPDYLRLLLSESGFRAQFMTTVAGVGGSLLRASPKAVNQFEVPIAPFAEQDRIVAKTVNLSAKSAHARTHLANVSKLTEVYKRTFLRKIFSGNLSGYSPTEFGLHPFVRVIQSTFYGPRIAREAYVENGIPTIRTSDIQDWGKIVLDSPPNVIVEDRELQKWQLQNHDLMVTRTGATIGKCALYEASIGPALPSAYLIRVRLDLAKIDAKFAVLFLLSPSGQEQLLAGRTAVAQPNINADAISSILIPLPEINTQRQVVKQIKSAFSWIDRLAAESANANKLVDRLDQSILTKAFRGELVPQDPDDEPASALLERIGAGKAGLTSTEKRRGRPPAAATA